MDKPVNARERVRDVGGESPRELLDVSRRMGGAKSKDRISERPPAFPKLIHDRHGSRVGNRSEPLWLDLVEQGKDRGDRKRGAFPLASLVGGPSALSRMPKLDPHGDEDSCGGYSGAAQGQGDNRPGGHHGGGDDIGGRKLTSGWSAVQASDEEPRPRAQRRVDRARLLVIGWTHVGHAIICRSRLDDGSLQAPKLTLEALDFRGEKNNRLPGCADLFARITLQTLAPFPDRFELILVHARHHLIESRVSQPTR